MVDKYDIILFKSKANSRFWSALGRAVPDRLAYWVLIAQSKHFGRTEIVPEVPFTTILDRLGKSLKETSR